MSTLFLMGKYGEKQMYVRIAGFPRCYWDRLFGQKRPLLIFSGTLSGKTKQIEEKNNDRNSRLFNINEPRKIKLMFI